MGGSHDRKTIAHDISFSQESSLSQMSLVNSDNAMDSEEEMVETSIDSLYDKKRRLGDSSLTRQTLGGLPTYPRNNGRRQRDDFESTSPWRSLTFMEQKAQMRGRKRPLRSHTLRPHHLKMQPAQDRTHLGRRQRDDSEIISLWGSLTFMEQKAQMRDRKRHPQSHTTRPHHHADEAAPTGDAPRQSPGGAIVPREIVVQPGAVWEGGSQSSARTLMDDSVTVPTPGSVDSAPRVAVAEIVDEQSLENRIREMVAQEAVPATVLTEDLNEHKPLLFWRRSRYLNLCFCLVLFFLAVALVVASAVGVTQVGGSPDAVAAAPTPGPSPLRSNHPSSLPTMSPTLSAVPSMTPTSPPTAIQPCVATLTELFRAEEMVDDVSVARTYVLCPATTYQIDRFVDGSGDIANTRDDFNNTAGFQHPLILRPNLLVQCGDNGRMENNCVFAGGDYSVLAQGPPRREILQNVVIKGMRFVDAQKFVALLQQPGDVTFVDCSFKTSVGWAPLLIRFSRSIWDFPLSDEGLRALRSKEGGVARNLQRAYPTLSVTFENCTFVGNSNLSQNSSWPGVITVVGDLVREVVVRGCLFQDNSYRFNESHVYGGYVIDNEEGSLLLLERNCFVNNQIEGPGLIQHIGLAEEVVSRDNYVLNGSVGAFDCSFVAHRPTLDVPFACLPAELDACAI